MRLISGFQRVRGVIRDWFLHGWPDCCPHPDLMEDEEGTVDCG